MPVMPVEGSSGFRTTWLVPFLRSHLRAADFSLRALRVELPAAKKGGELQFRGVRIGSRSW